MQILKAVGEGVSQIRQNLAHNVTTVLERLDQDVAASLVADEAEEAEAAAAPRSKAAARYALANELEIYKRLLDDSHLEHLELSKQSRLLLAEKEAEVTYWKKKCGGVPAPAGAGVEGSTAGDAATTGDGDGGDDHDDDEALTVERLKAERAALEESLMVLGSQLRESIRESNEVKAAAAQRALAVDRYIALKVSGTRRRGPGIVGVPAARQHPFLTCFRPLPLCTTSVVCTQHKETHDAYVAAAEERDRDKGDTIDNLALEYSKLASECELRQGSESARLLEVLPVAPPRQRSPRI